MYSFMRDKPAWDHGVYFHPNPRLMVDMCAGLWIHNVVLVLIYIRVWNNRPKRTEGECSANCSPSVFFRARTSNHHSLARHTVVSTMDNLNHCILLINHVHTCWISRKKNSIVDYLQLRFRRSIINWKTHCTFPRAARRHFDIRAYYWFAGLIVSDWGN